MSKFNTGKVFLFGGIGILLAYLFTQGRSIANLIFSPGSVSSMSFVGATPQATISIMVMNTSNLPVTISSFAANILSNGSYIGDVSNFFPVVIQPNSKTAFNVNADFQLIGIVNDIINAFQTKSIKQNLEIKGYANIDGQQIPVDINFTVGS